jgi:hypothetical protein
VRHALSSPLPPLPFLSSISPQQFELGGKRTACGQVARRGGASHLGNDFSPEKHALHDHRCSNPWPLASLVRPLTTPPVKCLCPFGIFVLPILCYFGFEINIWDHKQIQMKKLLATKFYNFLRTTTLVLVISLSDVIWIIWISNMRKFDRNFSWIDDFKWKSC